jgi:Ca2+-binding RTX toxin-like protein
MRAVLAVILVAIGFAAPSPAQGKQDQPSGSATITPTAGTSSGVGGARVDWTASCPDPNGGPSHYWYVIIDSYHQDGSHAVYRSTAESGVTSDARTQTIPLPMAQGLNAETFRVTVTLSCYPTPDEVIGEQSISVSNAGGGDGGGGHGGGGNGGGNGGGGSGGADPTDPVRVGGCAVALRGTEGPDNLDGDAADDLLVGLGDNDRIRGHDGDDCLIGDAGDDRLAGAGGYDRLTGGSGADRLDGGSGLNAYDAGSGDDSIEARNGRGETVRCGPGDDTVRGDANDRLVGCEHVR